jgi:hypothetical protein
MTKLHIPIQLITFMVISRLNVTELKSWAKCCFTIDNNAYKISCVDPNIVSFQHQSVEPGQMHLGFISDDCVLYLVYKMENHDGQ